MGVANVAVPDRIRKIVEMGVLQDPKASPYPPLRKISNDLSRVHHTKLGSFRIQHDRYKKHYVRCEDDDIVCPLDADMYHFRNRLQLLQHEVVICPDIKQAIEPFDSFFENHTLPRAMKKIKLLKKKADM